jgi:hypothetical protein
VPDPTQPVPGPTRELTDDEQSLTSALAPFGWICGPGFWERYYQDPWVFNLANAVERLSRAALLPARPSPTDDDRCPNGHPFVPAHPFVPGIDIDNPDKPDYRWCNTCGEAVCLSEDVVREWAEDERDSCTLACHVLDVLAYVDTLRQALADRQIVLDQNRAYWAEIERLRSHQEPA